MSNHTIKTPCIGLCSTIYGDVICRGCKRFSHEIIAWNGYTDAAQTAVLNRLDMLVTQVMQSKVQLLNRMCLVSALKKYNLRFNMQQSSYQMAYCLIMQGNLDIKQLRIYGIILKAAYVEWTLSQLCEAINREFFVLSEAHYNRYILPR